MYRPIVSLNLDDTQDMQLNQICRGYRLVHTELPLCSSFFVSCCASQAVPCIADCIFVSSFLHLFCLVFSFLIMFSEIYNVRIYLYLLKNVNNRQKRRRSSLAFHHCLLVDEPTLVTRCIPSMVSGMMICLLLLLV